MSRTKLLVFTYSNAFSNGVGFTDSDFETYNLFQVGYKPDLHLKNLATKMRRPIIAETVWLSYGVDEGIVSFGGVATAIAPLSRNDRETLMRLIAAS